MHVRIAFDTGASLGPGKVAVLEAVAAKGSISAAARSLGMSYRRAWLHIDALNRMFVTPSVETTPGRRGEGAVVTSFGHDVIAAFRNLQEQARAVTPHALLALEAQLAPQPISPLPPLPDTPDPT